MKKLKVMLGTTIILGIPTLGMTPVVFGASIEPAVEIKYNLDPTVFSKQQIKATFSAKEEDRVKVYFFDTAERTFFANDSIQRLRVYEGKDTYDITYKKRLQQLSLVEAIEELESHGFTGSESNYKFEIDSKNGQDPLSVSRKEKIKTTKNISYNVVDEKAAIKAVQENVPKKIENWDPKNWFKTTLQASQMTDPANVQTYTGVYQGIDAEIEYWEYHGNTMVELSTKTSVENATQVKENWGKQLQESNYLSEDQRGKTNFVLFE